MSYRPSQRAAFYSESYPKYPPLASNDDWLVGAWAIGACYQSPNPLYGAYPRGYLERVHSMFPDAKHVLHAFSGGLTHDAAATALMSAFAKCDTLEGPCSCGGWHDGSIELVDLHGPDEGRYPTWQGDVLDMPKEWTSRFDLVLSDPPYGPEHAARYGTPMPNRRLVMDALHRVTRPGGNLVWIDLIHPMHRKDQWRQWGSILLQRSTNHRYRGVTMFEAVR